MRQVQAHGQTELPRRLAVHHQQRVQHAQAVLAVIRQPAGQDRRACPARANLDKLRGLDRHGLRRPRGHAGAAPKLGRLVVPGEARGVVGLPRVGLGLGVGLQLDLDVQDPAAAGQAGPLHEAGQALPLPVAEPAPALDLAVVRPRLGHGNLVGRHHRVPVFLGRRAVEVFVREVRFRQAQGDLLGHAVAAPGEIHHRPDRAGVRIDVHLEVLVAERGSFGQRWRRLARPTPKTESSRGCLRRLGLRADPRKPEPRHFDGLRGDCLLAGLLAGPGRTSANGPGPEHAA